MPVYSGENGHHHDRNSHHSLLASFAAAVWEVTRSEDAAVVGASAASDVLRSEKDPSTRSPSNGPVDSCLVEAPEWSEVPEGLVQ